MPEPERAEGANLIRQITKIVRAADEQFERTGGSSRHWVVECFLPHLQDAGFEIVSNSQLSASEERVKELEKEAEAWKRTASGVYGDHLILCMNIGKHVSLSLDNMHQITVNSMATEESHPVPETGEEDDN